MWRNLLIILSAVCLLFAALTGAIWHIGDQDVNLFYLGLMFFVLSFLTLPLLSRRTRSGAV
jgi:hypothetical protein